MSGGEIMLSTTFVLTDEKTLGFREVMRDIPMKGPHRVQRIFVNRSDKVAVYEENLGPWLLFTNPYETQAWLGWEYSVGEAREIADRMRDGNQDPEPRPARTAKELLAVYADNLDERKRIVKHQTTSGPLVTVQRD